MWSFHKIIFKIVFDNIVIRKLLTIFSIVISSSIVIILLLVFTLKVKELAAPAFLNEFIGKEIRSLFVENRFEFDRIQISLDEKFKPKIIATDVTIFDDPNNLPFLEISKIELGLSLESFLSGKFSLSTVSADGLIVGVIRNSSGVYSLKLGDSLLSSSGDSDLVALTTTVKNSLQRESFSNLESFTVTSMTVQYDDQKASKLWVVDGARIEIKKDLDNIFLRGDCAFLMGGADISTLQINYETNLNSDDGNLGILFDDFPSKEIASQSPALSWLNVIEAPISGAFRTKIGSDLDVREISASLKIGQGVLRADDKSKPLRFDNANVYFSYDRPSDVINFEEININSTDLNATLAGFVRLGVDQNEKTYYVGTLKANTLETNPLEIYQDPLKFEEVEIEFKLEPEPFQLEVSHLSVKDSARNLVIWATGQVISGRSGWEVFSEVKSDRANSGDIIAYWPPKFKKNGRLWLEKNVSNANLNNLYAAVTFGSNIKPKVAMGYSFSNANINLVEGFPPLEQAAGKYSFYDRRFSIDLSSGYVGGKLDRLDLSGSNLIVNNTEIKPYPAQINLNSAGSLATLPSLFDFADDYGFAQQQNTDGDIKLNGILKLPLKTKISSDDVKYKLFGVLENIKIRDERFPFDIHSPKLAFKINEGSLQLSGPLSIGEISFDARFISGFGAQRAKISPRLEGKFSLSENIIEDLQLGVSKNWFSGSALASVIMDFPSDGDATFRLTSDLKGLEVQIPEVGLLKNKKASSSFEVTGYISDNIYYDTMFISAEDFELNVSIDNNGKYLIERLFRKDIFDVSGFASKDGLEFTGGKFNLANYLKFIEPKHKSKSGIPVSVNLDTLNITDSFYIDNFSTRFVSDSINGKFAGLFMGAEPVTGSFGSENGYRFAEILSNDAGAFLQAAGLIKRGAEGKLNLRINRNADGIKGRLFTESLKIYDLPALAKLLQSLSIIGLLEQMLGQGLFLAESEINFRLDDKQYIIDRASFFGPSLGISLDGYLNRKDRLLDFQGVFSPIYAINSIGSVLTRKGEGLIGINFDLWGNPDTPKVLVNPFSVLTPGMFREIFRRPPPKVETD